MVGTPEVKIILSNSNSPIYLLASSIKALLSLCRAVIIPNSKLRPKSPKPISVLAPPRSIKRELSIFKDNILARFSTPTLVKNASNSPLIILNSIPNLSLISLKNSLEFAASLKACVATAMLESNFASLTSSPIASLILSIASLAKPFEPSPLADPTIRSKLYSHSKFPLPNLRILQALIVLLPRSIAIT